MIVSEFYMDQYLIVNATQKLNCLLTEQKLIDACFETFIFLVLSDEPHTLTKLFSYT